MAVALLAGADWAPYAGAGLLTLFAFAAAVALAAGRGGAPCACFGARSRLRPRVVVRNLVLAAAFASVPWLPGGSPTSTEWLTLGLVAAFACIVALTVAVLALTRELGVLRLRLQPESALDIADEGPALGSRVDIPRTSATPLTLAVFSSEGCRVCQLLEPVVESFRDASSLTVAEFDEVRDADVWRRLAIPGSPYAVAVDREGLVRAKGTFNSYGQLESVVAAAERSVVAA